MSRSESRSSDLSNKKKGRLRGTTATIESMKVKVTEKLNSRLNSDKLEESVNPKRRDIQANDLFLRHREIREERAKRDAGKAAVATEQRAGLKPAKDQLAGFKKPAKQVGRNFLVLFSGTDSVGDTLRKMYPNCTVVNVDINESSPKITHCVDILDWKYKQQYKPGHFDCIFASPPCTGFSNAQALNEETIEKQMKFHLGCDIAKKAIY